MKDVKEHEGMDASHRLHREEPERTAPIRNWSTLYRAADSWNADTLASPAPTAEKAQQNGAPSDTVTHGVRLGYQVIEEHLQQGQHIARQINNRSYNMKSAGQGVSGLLERLVRDSTNILSLWFDLVNSLTGNPDLLRQFSRDESPSHATPEQEPFRQKPSPNAETTSPGTKVSVEISVQGRTQVILDLSPGAEQSFLATPGLHAMSAEKPPLTDITFLPGLDGDTARLRIRVPEGHPPDLYTGVLVDRTTGLPQGTLSVRIDN